MRARTSKCVVCGKLLTSKQWICCSPECAKERQRIMQQAYYKNNPVCRLKKAQACKRRRDASSKRNSYGLGFGIKNPFTLTKKSTLSDRQRYFVLKYGSSGINER